MGRTSYFEVIPSDTLSVIVQHVSERPHSEEWLRALEHGDTLTLLKTGGALGAIARQLFRYSNKLLKLNKKAEFCSLVNAMAVSVECLVVFPYLLWTLDWGRFSSLRTLLIYGYTDIHSVQCIVTLCGHNLRELHLSNMKLEQDRIRTLAQHCDSLEVLTLREVKYEGTLEPMWLAVGRNLRTLHGNIPEKEFLYIASSCTRLEALELSDFESIMFSDNTYTLLRVRWTLRRLMIGTCNRRVPTLSTVEHLRELFSNCPSLLNIYLTTFSDHSDNCVDYILVMGSRLRTLILNCVLRPLPSAVSALLGNIEELTLLLNDDFPSALQSIFVERMPKLRLLSVEKLHSSKMLPVLARSVSSLRVFRCSLTPRFENDVKVKPFKSLDFADFLQANKELKCFDMRYSCSNRERFDFGDEMMHETTDLIRRMRRNSTLTELKIDLGGAVDTADSQKIRNACVPLRTKRVDVVVNGVRFLPP